MVRELFDTIATMMMSGLMLAFFLGVAYRIMHTGGAKWRQFSSAYPRRVHGNPIARKASGAVRVSAPGRRWGVYSGDLKANHLPPVWVSVYDDGLLLSVYGIIHYGQPDMFLPFEDMSVRPAKMGLVDCYGVQMRRVPDLEILLYDDIIEWGAGHAPALEAMIKRAALGMEIFAGNASVAEGVTFGRRRRVRDSQ